MRLIYQTTASCRSSLGKPNKAQQVCFPGPADFRNNGQRKERASTLPWSAMAHAGPPSWMRFWGSKHRVVCRARDGLMLYPVCRYRPRLGPRSCSGGKILRRRAMVGGHGDARDSGDDLQSGGARFPFARGSFSLELAAIDVMLASKLYRSGRTWAPVLPTQTPPEFHTGERRHDGRRWCLAGLGSGRDSWVQGFQPGPSRVQSGTNIETACGGPTLARKGGIR